MKKRFLIPASVLATAAFGFVIYAMGHPELSFLWVICTVGGSDKLHAIQEKQINLD